MSVLNEIWIACDPNGSACLFAEKPDMRRSGIYAISGNAKDARCEHLRAFQYAVPPGECRRYRLVQDDEPAPHVVTVGPVDSKPPRGVRDPRWFEAALAALAGRRANPNVTSHIGAQDVAVNDADSLMKLVYAREDAEKGGA